MKRRKNQDELLLALERWKTALRRFDLAEKDEAAFSALEAEAARRRFICLLNRRKAQPTN